MGEPLSDAGAVAGIAGLIVSIIIAVYIRHLDKKQRISDELYYRHQTLNNIRTISKHIIDILDTSTGEDTRTSQEYENNTKELKKYFAKNSYNMRLLIQDSKFTLSKWITLKLEGRTEIQHIIDSLDWILETYFPDKGNSDALQQRIWTTHYDELEKRKNKIVEIVSSITTRYNQ